MGGPAGVREPMGASRGLRTNRRPAGFRKPMGAQQEVEGQDISSCKKANGRQVSAGTGKLMRGPSRCWRATGAQQAPEGPRGPSRSLRTRKRKS